MTFDEFNGYIFFTAILSPLMRAIKSTIYRITFSSVNINHLISYNHKTIDDRIYVYLSQWLSGGEIVLRIEVLTFH